MSELAAILNPDMSDFRVLFHLLPLKVEKEGAKGEREKEKKEGICPRRWPSKRGNARSSKNKAGHCEVSKA